MSGSGSLLRGRYLVTNPVANAALRAHDMVIERLADARRDGAPPPPRRLLLAIGGHLGDAVLATTVFQPIRRAWPGAEIGVLTGSWNRRVLEGHPLIARFHFADHWKLDRSGDLLPLRAARAAWTQQRAAINVRRAGYDTAIDLYPYYPNASLLLRHAAVPVRVGYASGGGGPHYTHALEWRQGGHAVDDHRRLLGVFGADFGPQEWFYDLPPIPEHAQRAASSLARVAAPKQHAVIHMGAGRAEKRWPVERWEAVVRALSTRGVPVLLTGSGARDAELAAQLRARAPDVISLTDALTWDQFRAVLEDARLVVSVDTAAAHIAAAHRARTVVLATGADDPRRWRPLGAHVTQVTDLSKESVVAAVSAALSGTAGAP